MRVESLRDLLSQFPDVDGLWDFGDILTTEFKIREVLPPTEQEVWDLRSLELLIQLARVQGLQGKLSEVGATLLQARDLISKSDTKTTKRAEVRFLIEQGRFFALSMNPSQALTHFTKALNLAAEQNEIFFFIESAVMLSISQPPKYQNEWLKKALEIAETTDDQSSKLWLSQLYVMNGWHAFDFRKYEEALESFNKALERPESTKQATTGLAIKWSIARTLRALNRLDESLKFQNELLNEVAATGKTNGHVFLEIAECLQLLKRYDEAKPNFEQAYKELSLNGWYTDNKAAELSRMQHISKKR
ncbi:MAG: hypothetical protein SGI74_04400 [Oligoflexia bacterium]|nr:hypothetical protein [Oligoflexia bacterium]